MFREPAPHAPLSLDGRPILRLKRLTADDRDELLRGFAKLSETSRYHRFLAPTQTLSQRNLTYLTEIDFVDHFAWAVLDQKGTGIAVARYVKSGERMAEVAITIADEYQGRRLGTKLLQVLALTAFDRGFTMLEMTMLSSNTPMIRIAQNAGARLDPPSDGLIRAELGISHHLWADLPEAPAIRRVAGSTTTAA